MLVVADEDAGPAGAFIVPPRAGRGPGGRRRPGRRPVAGAGAPGAGRQRDREARPLTWQRLDGDRPPLASTKPLTMARPSPDPVQDLGPRRAAAVERLEDPLLLGRRDARPLVDDADQNAARPRRRVDRDRPATAVTPGRSPAGSRTRAPAGRRRRAHRDVGVDVRRDVDALAAQLLAGGRDEILDRHPIAARRGARPPAAWRGQAGSRPARQPRRPPSTTAALSSLRSSVAERGRVERVAGGDDRGQRRAQIVGDRAQERGLDVIGRGAARPSPPARPASRRGAGRSRRAPRARARPRSRSRCSTSGQVPRDEQRRDLPAVGAASANAAGAVVAPATPTSIAAEGARGRSATRRRGAGQRPGAVLAEQQLAGQRRREVGLGAPALGLERT